MKSFYTPLGRQGSRLCATGLAAVLVASMVGMSVASMWGTRAGPARQGAFIARPSLLGKRRATEVMPARVSYTGSPFIAVNHTGRPIPSALALQVRRGAWLSQSAFPPVRSLTRGASARPCAWWFLSVSRRRR